MSVRMKMTRAKTGARRGGHKDLGAPRLTKDHDTGEMRPRHRASMATGTYRGRVVVDMTAKIAKREKKQKEREREAAKLGETVKERKPEDEQKPASAEPRAPLDAAKLSQREQ